MKKINSFLILGVIMLFFVLFTFTTIYINYNRANDYIVNFKGETLGGDYSIEINQKAYNNIFRLDGTVEKKIGNVILKDESDEVKVIIKNKNNIIQESYMKIEEEYKEFRFTIINDESVHKITNVIIESDNLLLNFEIE